MKNQFLIRGGLFVSLSVLLMMTSCKKDAVSGSSDDQNEEKTNEPAIALSDSSNTADFAYTDATTNVFYGYIDNMIANTSHPQHVGSVATMGTTANGSERLSCAEATLVSQDGGFPKTLTLDFGSGCSNSSDGIVRTGKITYIFSGDLIYAGTVVTGTFDNYSVNGYKLQGTYTLTNASGEIYVNNDYSYDSITIFKTKIENGVFTFPNGKSYQYSDNKTYTTKSGTHQNNTFAFDSLSIVGESHITSSNGDSLSTTVITPLVKKLDCRNISFGIESFIYNGKISGTVDFGNGDCDNSAIVKIGSSSTTIALQ